MRVFVAGATGAVGSRLTRLLVSSGHSVVGLTRTATKAEAIERAGAEVSVADALNRAAIVAAVTGARPDVIVHEMTAISAANDLRRFDRSFAATNRLRSQGLDNLLAAAKQVDTPRVIAQSFCGWPYARIGGAVKSEDDPLDPNPPSQMRRALAAIRYLENTLTAAPDIAGLVPRYGAFYGPGTGLFAGPVIDRLPSARTADRRRQWLVVVCAYRGCGGCHRHRRRARCTWHLQHCRRRAGSCPRVAAGTRRDAGCKTTQACPEVARPHRRGRTPRDVDDRGARRLERQGETPPRLATRTCLMAARLH